MHAHREVKTGRSAPNSRTRRGHLKFETPEGDDHWRFNATDFIPGFRSDRA